MRSGLCWPMNLATAGSCWEQRFGGDDAQGLVHTLMPLDGFIAGPNDNMGWVLRHGGDMPSGVVDEVIASPSAHGKIIVSETRLSRRAGPTRCH